MCPLANVWESLSLVESQKNPRLREAKGDVEENVKPLIVSYERGSRHRVPPKQ